MVYTHTRIFTDVNQNIVISNTRNNHAPTAVDWAYTTGVNTHTLFTHTHTEVDGDVLEVGLHTLWLQNLVVSQDGEIARVVFKVALRDREGEEGREGGRGKEEIEGSGREGRGECERQRKGRTLIGSHKFHK